MAGKAELVEKITELTGGPKTRVSICYDTLFELMAESLAKGSS